MSPIHLSDRLANAYMSWRLSWQFRQRRGRHKLFHAKTDYMVQNMKTNSNAIHATKYSSRSVLLRRRAKKIHKVYAIPERSHIYWSNIKQTPLGAYKPQTPSWLVVLRIKFADLLGLEAGQALDCTRILVCGDTFYFRVQRPRRQHMCPLIWSFVL